MMNDVSGSLIAILGTDPGPVFLIYPSKRPPLILIREDPQGQWE